MSAMPSTPLEKAKRIFGEQKAHCAQAIFSSYGEQLNLGKVDFDTCIKISSAFSGGIARSGNVCGAVTGALMTLGLKYGEDAQKVNDIAVKFFDEFKALNESIICRELINNDLITDEDLKQAYANGSFDKCLKYVEDAGIILEKMLANP
ncbi:MAG: C-GCAxxG-C-C family protein [Candidatus Thorarchaeota archaeon]